ncbi:hypothetical protein J5N97_028102 [Dioscorea zingiberensis]|uniref:Uncharacterized protein n=1 Tax=Dioscorea zingiberensis TaxID=325984 RepID=A0A9D5BYI2_9LILI|nr:hypothetical protein J5N97_028102 [Dioscorea zingiberensis]
MAEHDKPPSPPVKHHQPTAPPPSAEEAAAGYYKAPPRYPNPPDATNPDPATLREQWRYATRQYSRWYGHTWGTAILAGAAFFALGWLIKGDNPLPSRSHSDDHRHDQPASDRA